jgi:hypothetical protein
VATTTDTSLLTAHAEKARLNVIVAFDLLEDAVSKLGELPAAVEMDVSITISKWIDEKQPEIRRLLDEIVATARSGV